MNHFQQKKDQDLDTLLPVAKKVTHAALQDDGPMHTLGIISTDGTTMQADDEDTESSSTQPLKKRSHAKASEATKDFWCDTCKKDYKTEHKLERHKKTLVHKGMAAFSARGIEAKIVHSGYNQAMTIEDAQEYQKDRRQLEEELQNQNIWEFDATTNTYTCKPYCASFPGAAHALKHALNTSSHQMKVAIKPEIHPCPICILESGEHLKFGTQFNLQRHESSQLHIKMKQFKTKGIEAIIVHLGGTHYQAMPIQKYQAYLEKKKGK